MGLQVAVAVNDVPGIRPDQTTTLLIRRALEREHQVHVFGVGDCGALPGGAVVANAARAGLGPGRGVTFSADTSMVDLGGVDLLLIRTSPGRDRPRFALHEVFLRLAEMARERGAVVVNDPAALARSATKLHLFDLPPAVRPRCLVTRDPAQVLAFVEEEAPRRSVIKPVVGTSGRDVFVLDPAAPQNIRGIVDVVTRQGYALVQDFVPEAVGGDVRVLVLEGQALAVEGRVAAVARIPGGEDFRSNVSAGGRARPTTLDEAAVRAVAAAGPILARDGVFLAGLDIAGGRILEVNVFSTGGLVDAELFMGVDYSGVVLAALEDRCAAHRAATT